MELGKLGRLGKFRYGILIWTNLEQRRHLLSENKHYH